MLFCAAHPARWLLPAVLFAALPNASMAQSDPSAPALTQPAPSPAESVRVLVVRPGDTLTQLLAGAGVEAEQARPAISALAPIFPPRRLQPGHEITVRQDPSRDDPAFACALTVQESHAFLWRASAEGGRGINHDEGRQRPLRQERAPEFRENGAGYAMRVADFRAVGRRFCGRVALVETFFHPVEIDALHDLELVNALVRQGGAVPVPAEDLRRVTTLVTDFDGVHTDDRVAVGQDGSESVVCSRSDGHGVAQLKAAGYRILILSRERNAVVARRAEKLGVEVLHGVDDKAPLLQAWLTARGLTWQDVAYVGNDDNDLDCLARAGVSFAPADAQPAAARVARASLSQGGGHGAVREVCDLLLASGR